MRAAWSVVAATALAAGALSAPAHAVSGSSRHSPQPVPRLLVKYRTASAHSAMVTLAVGHRSIRAAVGRPNGAGISTVVLPQALGESDARAAAASLRTRSDVEWAVPDRQVRMAAVPNDTYYGQQWGLAGATGVHAPAAWSVTTGRSPIVVAVVDTGYLDHADLAGQFVSGYDMISCDTTAGVPDCSNANDGDARDPDAHDPGDWHVDAVTGKSVTSSWHGTHVSGIIAALQGNSMGVTGLAPGVRLQPVRVLGTQGGWLSDVIDAITWAAGGTVAGVPANPTPARVINMSLGAAGACDAATQAALDYAYDAGVITVVAAGNDGVDASTQTPAGCRHVITVGATTAAGTRAPFSNFGTAVDVSAPGDAIYSTYNRGSRSPASDSYALLSGTSMATPFASAAVALMLSSMPSLSAAQVYSRIRDQRFATPFPGALCDADPAKTCGAGILDAATLVGGEPVLGDPVPTADGFTVSVLNANADLTYTSAPSLGSSSQASQPDGTVLVTVSGLLARTTGSVTVTVSGTGGDIASASATGTSLCGTDAPVVGAVTRRDRGFTAPITNYSPDSEWVVAASAGTAMVQTSGTLEVTGLDSAQGASVAVTATAPGCAPTTVTVTGAALPDVVLRAVTGVAVGRSHTGLRVSWTRPPQQDGRVIGVKVRMSRVNSTRYGAWVNVGTRTYWRTPVLRHGRYRIQFVTVYLGRTGPLITRRASF